VNLKTKNMQNWFRADADTRRAVEAGMGHSLVAISVKMAQRMSDLLKKDHKLQIGYTEKASQNLEVIPAGNNHWAVIEGSLTPANQFIRRGWRSQRIPKPEALMEWIERKPGVKEKLFTEEQRDKKYGKYRFTEYGGERADRRNRPGRIFKRDRDRFREFAYLVGRRIRERGGAWHFETMDPVGDPVFDYPRWAIYHSGFAQFKSEFFETYGLRGLAYVIDYLQSDGRSPGNVPRRKISDIDSYRVYPGYDQYGPSGGF